MIEYRFARPEEEDDILDFIDFVFSQSARPHNFREMLPKVYARPGFSPYHAVAVRDGRIKAAVATLPMTLKTQAGDTLTGGYIGSVSVHGQERSQGHMKALMDMQIADAQKKGYDFLALGGRRQRYGYWGFENAGGAVSFSFHSYNVRHALGDVDAERVTLKPLQGPDDPALDALIALHKKRLIRCERPRALWYDTLRSYSGETLIVRDGKDGEAAGYLVIHGTTVTEWGLRDDALLEPVIKRWIEERTDGRVLLPLTEPGRIAALGRIAQSYSVADTVMLRVLNWQKVLGAMLRVQMLVRPLPEGEFTVEITGVGRIRLSVRNGEATAEPTEQTPDHVLTEQQAVAFFFSPLSVLLSPDPLARCWLPLPLDIPTADQF